MPDLLDKIAEDFKTNNHDIKRLCRWIVTSKAYGLSTRVRGKLNEDTEGFFTHQLCKPMTPEQIYDSVLAFTQIHKTSKNQSTQEERQRFLGEFLRTFGGDETQTAAPRFNGTITQSLMMMNSPLMTQATSCTPGSYLHTLASDTKLDDLEKAERIYLAGLSRKMNNLERQNAARLFQSARSAEQKQMVLSDLMWVVLNSSEFILNH